MPRYRSKISNPNAGLSCLSPDFDGDWDMSDEELKEEQEAEAADYYEERNGV